MDLKNSNYKFSNEPLAQGQGWALYSSSNLVPRNAVDKHGLERTVGLDYYAYWTTLSPWDSLEIYRLQSIIYSIVTQRAMIFSGMEDRIVPNYKIEDEIVYKLDEHKLILEEIDPEQDPYEYAKHFFEINKYLHNYYLKTDMSNYDKCKRMFIKSIKRHINRSAQEVLDWLYQPKQGYQIQDFKKQWVIDNLVHGRNVIQRPNKNFDGFALLPGGTVYKVPDIFVGQHSYERYVQLTYGYFGWDTTQRPLYFTSEDLSCGYYIPNSAVTNGVKPLDAVINNVITAVNVDSLLMENSNNEKPPEYLIMVMDNGIEPESIATGSEQVDQIELERLEESVNVKKKDRAIKIVKQYGNSAELMNLSKENLISILNPYIDVIRKAISQAFHATPNEMGETDTGGMIAKSGAEQQRELYLNQSIKPLSQMWENQFTHEIIKGRFGIRPLTDIGIDPYWTLKLDTQLSENELLDNAVKMIGLPYTPNEIREYLGKDPINDDSANRLQTAQQETFQEEKSIANYKTKLGKRKLVNRNIL